MDIIANQISRKSDVLKMVKYVWHTFWFVRHIIQSNNKIIKLYVTSYVVIPISSGHVSIKVSLKTHLSSPLRSRCRASFISTKSDQTFRFYLCRSTSNVCSIRKGFHSSCLHNWCILTRQTINLTSNYNVLNYTKTSSIFTTWNYLLWHPHQRYFKPLLFCLSCIVG